MVTWGILDPYIQNWYIANQRRIDAMDFATYIAELHQVWLPADWEKRVQARVLETPQGDRVFWDWAVEIQSTNALLYDTTSLVSEDALRNQIEASHHAELTTLCQNNQVDDIQDFHTWLEAVRQVDDKRQRDIAAQCQIAEDIYRDRNR